MTSMMLRRVGRIGLVLFALAAFAAFLAPWLVRDNGDALIGLDLGYLAYELADEPYPMTQLFVEMAPLPAYIAVLLAPTVAVRRRWARRVAVALVVLTAVLTAAAAATLFTSIEDYWAPDHAQRYRLFALVVAALAALVLGAAVVLALGRQRAYAVVVGLLMLAFSAFHVVNLVVLAALRSTTVDLNPVAWLPAVAYLLAAGCVAIAAVGAAAAARVEQAQVPTQPDLVPTT